MKRSTLTIAGILTVTSLVLGGQVAHAASNYTTSGTVTIEAGEGQVTPPVDGGGDKTPSVDPDKPGTTQPGTGDKGTLTLDTVPNLVFGKQRVSSEAKTYPALNSTIAQEAGAGAAKNWAPYVQVTDVRGTGAGYKLTATMSEFKAGANVLAGAQIKFANGTVSNEKANDAVAPTITDGVLEAGTDAVPLLTAAKGQGMSTYTGRFTDANVTLSVPGASKVGAYTATITWTLVEAP